MRGAGAIESESSTLAEQYIVSPEPNVLQELARQFEEEQCSKLSQARAQAERGERDCRYVFEPAGVHSYVSGRRFDSEGHIIPSGGGNASD